MTEPEQPQPTYGPPPAAAYDQPWGPPAPVPVPPYPAPAAPSAVPVMYPAPAAYAPQTDPAAPAYPAPAAYPTPAAYPAPTPFAAPYAAPASATFGEAAPAPRGAGLGVIALIVGIVAVVVTPIVAAIASYSIGLGVGREVALRPSSASFDLSLLSPVRDSVLLGEIAFWTGTVLGIWALVQGIVAIVKRRGRGAGIAAVVVAVLGPIAFGIAVNVFVFAGIAAGSSIGG